jgi:L-fuconolactonase
MRSTWRAATDLGLAIQMHFTPWHADSIANLAQEFRSTTVILDHLGRAGMGTPAEYDRVLALAKLPKTVMKFSGWSYSTKQAHPHRDLTPLVKRTFDAFGSDRMIWGGLGHNRAQFDKAAEVFETAFGFASESDRAKVRGLTAKAIFRW